MVIHQPLSITLHPVNHFSGVVHLPGSKSLSNRALLLAALTQGTTRLKHLLQSDDVTHMLIALTSLSVHCDIRNNGMECDVQGRGALSDCNGKTLYLGNSGTTMRFMTAILSMFPNDVILTGDARMRERPIFELVEALKQGGARIKYMDRLGYPPIRIYGGFRGGNIVIDGSRSSQFLSALLMAAPLAEQETHITLQGKQVSQPYVDMTLKIMETFGVDVEYFHPEKFIIKGKQVYQAVEEYYIEGDATAASYFLAGAAIKGGPVQVVGVSRKSSQGDIAITDILRRMGAHIHWYENGVACQKGELKGIDVDVNTIPDAAMTLAIVALFAKGRSVLRNIGTWRLKECDRLKAMATELQKVGARITEGEDFIMIDPPLIWKAAQIETYNDHRMAMCFSLISLSEDVPVCIINPKCTTKTFPNYFNEFAKLTKEE